MFLLFFILSDSEEQAARTDREGTGTLILEKKMYCVATDTCDKVLHSTIPRRSTHQPEYYCAEGARTLTNTMHYILIKPATAASVRPALVIPYQVFK